METLGQRLRISRKSAGMSQEKLAKKVGISKGSVSQYENSAVNVEIGVSIALRIADALGVEIRWLVTGKNPKSRDEISPKYIVQLESAPPQVRDAFEKLLEYMMDHKEET